MAEIDGAESLKPRLHLLLTSISSDRITTLQTGTNYIQI